MTLRKRTIDNSVRHILQSEQFQSNSGSSKSNTSLSRKQNRKLSQIIQNFFAKFSAEGFKFNK